MPANDASARPSTPPPKISVDFNIIITDVFNDVLSGTLTHY